ncbi:hypothetical protein ACLNAR_27900 [Priestia aryabhattai]|uniref:hypothetical protein n=1 Tax=Priestia aryabhattai TaxID=412384 RepID=UPI00398EDE04
MSKKILFISTGILTLVQLVILYTWLVDWEKLVTTYGLISWIGSIILGIIIYKMYLGKNEKEKLYISFKRINFLSTMLMIFLGVLSLLIEFATQSMP